MSVIAVFWRWLLTLIRDFANDKLDPEWRAKNEQLQRDAAAHQRKEQTVRDDIAVIDAAVKHEEEQRIQANADLDKATDLEDLFQTHQKQR